jgi:hypothetical protein
MAKLTAAARKKIPTKSFAGPERSYPIQDRSHAANALDGLGARGRINVDGFFFIGALTEVHLHW